MPSRTPRSVDTGKARPPARGRRPASSVTGPAPVAASRTLLEGDVSRKKRRKVIDKMAAVYILQGFLDRQQHLK